MVTRHLLFALFKQVSFWVIFFASFSFHFVIAQDTPLIIGTELGYPPFSYQDENGQAIGYNVDLTNSIAQAMHLNVEIRIGPWGEIRRALETGEIDAIVGMYYSVERDKNLDFSPSFATIRHAIFVHQNSPAIENQEQLHDKSIIVMQGDIMHDFVIENRLTENLTTVSTLADGLQLLSQGQHDCALMGRYQGTYWINKLQLTNIDFSGPPLNLSHYCFAVKSGNVALQNDLVEGLTLLNNTGKEKEIYDRWLGVFEHTSLFKYFVVKYGVPLGIVLLSLILIFAYRAGKLGKMVAVQAKDLNERVKELQCIFRVADLIIKEKTIEDLLQKTAALIPQGWSFPDITRACIVFDGQKYYSESFSPSQWCQSEEIMIDGQCRGKVEIYYIEKCPHLEEGPFMLEERKLITGIAQLLSESIHSRLVQEKLAVKKGKYRQLFQEMLNGFAVHEVICDDKNYPIDYRFLDVNPAFERITGLKAENVVGKTVLEVLPGTEKAWIARYGMVGLTRKPDFFENYAHEFDKHFEVTAFSPSPNEFACIFADVTEKKKFEDSLASHRDRLQSLAFRLANAEELLRQDIAAGLHDSIGQDLAALKLNVDIMRLNSVAGENTNSDKTGKTLDSISDAINEVVHKIWSLSFQLCPPGLFKAGFLPTLEWLLEQFNSKYENNFHLVVENKPPEMDKQSRGILFQMIRELILNSIKHSNATDIKIVLEMEEDNLLVSVIDNGCGFNVLETMVATESSGGFGLFSIQERLAFLSGKLKIESDVNSGTRIMIIFPLGTVIPEKRET